jgi:hypothetical protein
MVKDPYFDCQIDREQRDLTKVAESARIIYPLCLLENWELLFLEYQRCKGYKNPGLG